MHIREFWNQLSPETQQWLIDNPGSVIVPRTLTAILSNETGEAPPVDAHGGTPLTDEDREFIQAQARDRRVRAANPRFFDSVRPQD